MNGLAPGIGISVVFLRRDLSAALYRRSHRPDLFSIWRFPLTHRQVDFSILRYQPQAWLPESHLHSSHGRSAPWAAAIPMFPTILASGFLRPKSRGSCGDFGKSPNPTYPI